MPQRFVIKGGMVAGFADELRLPMTDIQKQRVSVIVPEKLLLRAAFCAVRAVVSEDGRVAAWTRTWPCNWLAKVSGVYHGPFANRAAAIAHEKAVVHCSGAVDAYLRHGVDGGT